MSMMGAVKPSSAEDGAGRSPLAVLISGGLDSAILLAEALREHDAVYPLYVRSGLYWEAAELRHLRRYLEAVYRPSLQPLHVLDLPVADLYGNHWSITGRDVPDSGSADEAVFLPGRNVLLLAKALLWCHLHQVPEVALAPLGANPFPDATPAFFNAFQEIVNHAVGGAVQVSRPYATLRKVEVMQRGRGLPLELTFSCIHPVDGRHCGRCNKCAERQHAFAAAGLIDKTEYRTRTTDHGPLPCIE
jgi:7-cyano-7-deazaguanine synthase